MKLVRLAPQLVVRTTFDSLKYNWQIHYVDEYGLFIYSLRNWHTIESMKCIKNKLNICEIGTR